MSNQAEAKKNRVDNVENVKPSSNRQEN